MAEEDLNDEGTDQSPSSTISSTDDLDAEKAYLTSSNLSVKVSNVPGVLHKTPTRTTTAASGIPPAQTASIHPQQQQQQLRRPIPAGFPRSYSYPSSTSSSSSISSSNSNTTVYNMRNKRNSSAYPLPSLSQLMAYDDAQRIITSGENPGNTSHSSSATAVGNAWFTTPQPLPPNSRSNTRRNSAIPYTLPPSPLRAHEEDQNAEEQPRIDVSENAASTSEAEEILVRGSELPVIQVEDGEAILRDKVSSQDNMVSEEEQENQNQRQRKISGTNRSIRSNVSSTPTTMTAYESLPAEEVGDNSVATSTATAVHDHHHHQEEQPQSDLQILGQKSNISVSSSGDTLNKILSLPMQSGQGSSSSGTNITNEDFLISRNSSSSSLQTSISEISIPSKDERFDIANSNGCKSVTRILYQKEHDNDGVSKGIRNLYLETVILHSSMIYGTIHVRNIQVKSVLVRITKDNWQSFTDTQAKFTDQNNDKWTFNIEINENEHLASLQMALCAIDIDGREEWDSNNGENYHIRL